VRRGTHIEAECAIEAESTPASRPWDQVTLDRRFRSAHCPDPFITSQTEPEKQKD